MNHVYLCSSSRHIYLAIGQLLKQPGCAHHLIMIGHKKGRKNLILDKLLSNPAPFTSVDVIEEEAGWRKYTHIRGHLKNLSAIVEKHRPEQVYVGNDTRVEYQHVMQQLKNSSITSSGYYLDDGSGSYINGRYLSKWSSFTHSYIDAPLKRLFYGECFDHSRYFGGCRWTDTCFLNFPELAPDYIKQNKNIIKLEPEDYKNAGFKQAISRLFFTEDQLDAMDCHGEVILLFPLASLVRRLYPSVEFYNKKINEFVSRYDSLVIKYHPRETEQYFKTEIPNRVLPSSIPAEMIFSFMDVSAVIGDLSSSLLSAAWLLPEVKAKCIWPKEIKPTRLLSMIDKTPVEIQYI